MSPPDNHDSPEPGPPRRSYDGTLRRQRAGETRDRIVAAGSELLHGYAVRDWQALTVRAVAERAGVNERTVYRIFGNERGLRDAVMHHNEEEAGINLEGMRLDDIAGIANRIFDHVSSYPQEVRPPLDPTLSEANQRQQQALLSAIAESTPGWSEQEQRSAAAMFDVLWSVASYERLVIDWKVDPAQAIKVITWVIGMVEDAVRNGRGPT
jgi:AcrR family transcriptional regulator